MLLNVFNRFGLTTGFVATPATVGKAGLFTDIVEEICCNP